MAEIKPFRGILYNNDTIKNISNVITPPYDVISSKDQQRYYNRNKFNIIRIILGKELPNDNENNNKYTRANEYFTTWLKKGVLTKEEKPAIYIYQEKYCFKGITKQQLGFIALAKLEDFKKKTIIPHEKTLSGPKQDRLNLLRACHANSSSIFSLYSDSRETINTILKPYTKTKPLINVSDEINITHKLWKITDPKVIKKIATFMKNKKVFIADGHHRYETALNFRNEIKQKLPSYKKIGNYDYVMMYFTNMENKNLTILPTHRLISIPKLKLVDLEEKLKKYFDIKLFLKKEQLFAVLEKEKGKNSSLFGMYKKEKNKYYLLSLKKNNSFLPADVPKTNIHKFHYLILEKLLEITSPDKKEKCLSYTRDANSAVTIVNKGLASIAFFLPPPSMEDIKNVASKGTTLPQKTTYFYPKLITGLVLNQLKF